LEAYQLVPKDEDGKNNPYIKIQNGKTKIKDLRTDKQNTERSEFFKCYELKSHFPGIEYHTSLQYLTFTNRSDKIEDFCMGLRSSGR
jgi:hypothetical protein